MSRQILIAPFDLGTTTITFIQLVGPSTLSIQSFSSKLVISFDTFLHASQGKRLTGCCTGMTDPSTCNFNW